MTLRTRRPSAATLIALLALFVALGGPAEAAKLINGKLIKPGTVRSKQVKNRSLSTVDLSSTAVRSLMRTPAGTIGTAQLAAGAVTGDRLASSSVGGSTVADDSITSADLAAGAVGNSELATSAVTRSKIASNGVGASEITAGAVTGSEVADGQLTGADIGEFTGSFNATVGTVGPGQCAQIDSPELAPIVAGGDLSNDAILVTPPAAFPDELTLVAKPLSATRIRLAVCNPTAAPAPTTPLADQAFRLIAFAA
jgi:hypothetical protein